MDKEARKRDLYARLNNRALETGERLQGEFFLRSLHLVDELDPSWTEAWLTWIYDHMYNRGVLDDKTRVLVIIGECVVGKHTAQLANHMRTALTVGASPEEILEVILQGSIYAGMPVFFESLKVYRELMSELGLVETTEPPFRGDALDPR